MKKDLHSTPFYGKVTTLFGALVLGLAFSSTPVQAQLLGSENFDSYTTGNLEGQGGWSVYGTTTGSAISLVSGSLTYAGYTTEATGYSVLLDNASASQNLSKSFLVEPASTEVVYYSLLVNFQQVPTESQYFMAVSQDLTDNSSADTDFARLYAQPATTADKVILGVTDGNSTVVATAPTEIALNTTTLVVLKVSSSNGTSSDQVDLFVNPIADAETASATFKAPAQGTSESSSKADAASAFAQVDGLRIANAWADLFDTSSGVEDTLNSSVKVNAIGQTITVNAEELQNIEVWALTGTLLSSQVASDNTATVDVDYNGIVVVKVTTANGTVVKKLIIQ